mgnify:CR=1 FL=1
MPRYSLRKHTATQRTITIGRDGKRRIEIDEAAFCARLRAPRAALRPRTLLFFGLASFVCFSFLLSRGSLSRARIFDG